MKLNPYLNFNGNCEEALNFYRDAFKGEILQLGRYGESPMENPEELNDKIIHARLKFGDTVIMFSDMMSEKEADAGNMISLSVECDTVEQLEKVFSKMAEGGKLRCLCRISFGEQDLECSLINLEFIGCLIVRRKVEQLFKKIMNKMIPCLKSVALPQKNAKEAVKFVRRYYEEIVEKWTIFL